MDPVFALYSREIMWTCRNSLLLLACLLLLDRVSARPLGPPFAYAKVASTRGKNDLDGSTVSVT